MCMVVHCFSYFSIAVKKHYDQGRKAFNGVFRGLVRNDHGGEHSYKKLSKTLEQELIDHILLLGQQVEMLV